MSAPRKQWATNYPNAPTSSKRHKSKLAAYEYVQRQVRLRKDGVLRQQHMEVFMDEGFGWQLFERVDLDELATVAHFVPSER